MCSVLRLPRPRVEIESWRQGKYIQREMQFLLPIEHTPLYLLQKPNHPGTIPHLFPHPPALLWITMCSSNAKVDVLSWLRHPPCCTERDTRMRNHHGNCLGCLLGPQFSALAQRPALSPWPVKNLASILLSVLSQPYLKSTEAWPTRDSIKDHYLSSDSHCAPTGHCPNRIQSRR